MEEKRFPCVIKTKSKKQNQESVFEFYQVPFRFKKLLTWFFSFDILMLNIINPSLSQQTLLLHTSHDVVQIVIKSEDLEVTLLEFKSLLYDLLAVQTRQVS